MMPYDEWILPLMFMTMLSARVLPIELSTCANSVLSFAQQHANVAEHCRYKVLNSIDCQVPIQIQISARQKWVAFINTMQQHSHELQTILNILMSSYFSDSHLKKRHNEHKIFKLVSYILILSGLLVQFDKQLDKYTSESKAVDAGMYRIAKSFNTAQYYANEFCGYTPTCPEHVNSKYCIVKPIEEEAPKFIKTVYDCND
eukprot:NODE_549_length_6180_cov_0.430357.p2 type:complete len:201 gc:universal NODE_549_length_6180_cov_0.430357:1357-755(-)